MAADLEQTVTQLFRAFNRREVEEAIALCADTLEFEAATAEFAGRGVYAGRDGMREYFADVERVWEELLITPRQVVARNGEALVVGRVFARGRRVGLRDLPVAWRLRASGGLFEWIKVYLDRPEAIRAWERATGGV